MIGANMHFKRNGRKLGRIKRSDNPHVPKLEHMLGMRNNQLPLPAVPRVLDRSAMLPGSVGMMLNGYDDTQPDAPQLGDCSIAGLFHGRQIANAMSARLPLKITNDAILEAYEGGCGYVLGDPSTDNGGILDKVLAYDNQHGIMINGVYDRNLLFFQFDVKNEDHLRHVINTYGYAYVGGEMPTSVINAPGIPFFDADAHAEIEGGHCYLIYGWDENGNYICITWGMTKVKLSPRFLTNFVDEGYGIISTELLDSSGRSPCGFTMAQLSQMAGMYREV